MMLPSSRSERIVMALLLLLLMSCWDVGSVTSSMANDMMSDCPLVGCNVQQQYLFRKPSEASGQGLIPSLELLWTSRPLFPSAAPSGRIQCSTLGGIAVCTHKTEVCAPARTHHTGRASSTAVVTALALNASTGTVQWRQNNTAVAETCGYPLLLASSEPPVPDLAIIWSTPALVGLDVSDGVPLGPSRPLPHETPTSPTLTNDSIVVLASRSGIISSDLTNGVPHASLVLHDVVAGVNGTWTPQGTPAVCGHRTYIPCAFIPSNSSTADAAHPHTTAQSSSSSALRLYAIDIVRASVGRMSVAWWADLKQRSLSPITSLSASSMQVLSVCTDTVRPMVLIASGSSVWRVNDMQTQAQVQWHSPMGEGQGQLLWDSENLWLVGSLPPPPPPPPQQQQQQQQQWGQAVVQLNLTDGARAGPSVLPCPGEACSLYNGLVVLSNTPTRERVLVIVSVNADRSVAMMHAARLFPAPVQRQTPVLTLPKDCAQTTPSLTPTATSKGNVAIVVACGESVSGVVLSMM